LVIPVLLLVAVAWLSPTSPALSVSVDAPPSEIQSGELLECFADGWTAEALEEAALELAGVKPCRPCQGREWCTCTYSGSGGGTRVSCDPCCYQQYGGQIICLD
jgi:hypothetical protein